VRVSENYSDLTDQQVMQLAIAMEQSPKAQQLHDYVEHVRSLVDGTNVITIPQSHRALNVGESHEGGLRLNARIRQGAAWLAGAKLRFSVTAGSLEHRADARLMEDFAKAGEAQLAQGTPLHRWSQEAARDLFECGVSIVQHHPRRDFYVKAQRDTSLLVKGARLKEVMWRRRIDPLYWYWEEDNDGTIGASMVKGRHAVSRLATIIDGARYDDVRANFAWAESMPDDRWSTDGTMVETKELLLPDRGVLIFSGEVKKGRGSRMKADDPRRIIASWKNYGRVPVYLRTASPWPWTSPLDEMIALTPERDYWATMLDMQAAGAIFRHWQLKDTNTGESLPAAIWSNPVPETVLLDLSKPPPNMGPGTEWVLAPFEYHDITARLQMIIAQHEAAGASVARLMGQIVNQNTAVGTADMMEDFARREFSDVIQSTEYMIKEMWEDTFRDIRRLHSKEPVVVIARKRDATEGQFYDQRVELKGSQVVSDDVSVSLDTRSRMSLIADYRTAREMMNNGDMSYERAVEQGSIPGVDDADAEVADIFLSQVEKITLEQEAMSHAQAVAENLGAAPTPMAPTAPPNITRGARTDPRGTGTERGPNNVSDTALASGASDTVRAI
jgi:hypothetical protein